MPQSILIIEDDNALRASMAMSLEDAGFAVHEASDAGAALRLFEQGRPDLVLLDLGIPGDDGMNVLRRLKAMRPSTPVIIVSGRTHISAAIEAFKAGAWDYIAKPIASMDVFINSLRNCLSQCRLQQRVQDVQEHLFQLVQNLPVIIFIINRNLEFEFLNQTTEQILGYSPQEILQAPRPFLKSIVPPDRKKFLRALKKSLEPGRTGFRIEFRFVHKKGYQIILRAQSIAYPLEEGAMPDRVEGLIMDVTRNSFMDKLLIQNEKLNMLRTMTEEVAHEIRNPLVSLGGFARQLRGKYPEAVETEVIMEECNRLERLVQRVNAYLEPMEVQLAPCALSPTLDFVTRMLSTRLERKSLTCTVNIDEKVGPVMADQDFLHRIFIYLIGHGADVVEEKGDIGITVVETDAATDINLTIAPVHVPVTDPNRLIMPFEDEEVNLAMCYRLVERIGGHLHLDRVQDRELLTVSFPKHPPLRAGGASPA